MSTPSLTTTSVATESCAPSDTNIGWVLPANKREKKSCDGKNNRTVSLAAKGWEWGGGGGGGEGGGEGDKRILRTWRVGRKGGKPGIHLLLLPPIVGPDSFFCLFPLGTNGKKLSEAAPACPPSSFPKMAGTGGLIVVSSGWGGRGRSRKERKTGPGRAGPGRAGPGR